APIELDEQAAEVAELLLADLQQRALLAPQQPGMRPPRSDALRTGAAATRGPPVKRPHGWSVRRASAPTLPAWRRSDGSASSGSARWVPASRSSRSKQGSTRSPSRSTVDAPRPPASAS